ncbi:MAG TPA: trypsin-like peptidase domain-containing protein [Sporichthyaceae bacterium]
MKPSQRRALFGAALLAATALSARPAGASTTPLPPWAPADRAKVHPGQVLDTKGSDCTSNFVFADAANHVYVGQAAHCSSEGNDVNVDGCKEKTLPLGTLVTVVESQIIGELAYNSWRTMQARHEPDQSACLDNDFALVRLPDADRAKVNPTVPFFGGPTAANTATVSAGDKLYAYGNTPLRGGIGMLSPKTGAVVMPVDDSWSYLTYFLSPGIPGDSGSAVLDAQGRALGVLSSLVTTPTPGSNGVSDLQRMLAYAQDMSGIVGLRLVAGTKPFSATG